ncbi:Phosphoglycolate phosphatase [Poriferisphaera corsica]|uniref:phosphoglycolate phosphatase n=1 Tax=Poriferisphaera corsica TaxID=2528020 RepID=A0A517YV81_9BACT|nr:HAD hydrolase-like protein [Poriferisphaera corsica]QDU34134.1 Phosphoglycolate phosphatase [Poriferisphaera corsica]
MHHTLLLFDIDGTILDAKGAGGKAWSRTAKQHFGDDFTIKQVQFAGNLDSIIYRQTAEHNNITDHHQHHEAFKSAYLKALHEELNQHDVKSHAGIDELIAQLNHLAQTGAPIMLGLLTGNYTEGAHLKLQAVGIDPAWFAISACGDEAQSRPDLTLLAMQKYESLIGVKANPKRIIVIGDTPKDVDCAKAHDCYAFAVATGPFSVEDLLKSGADTAVSDLSDHTPLFNIMDRITTA